jgi:hypothetical protein
MRPDWMMGSGRTTLGLIGVTLLAAFASACLNYPRNNQELATKATEVAFEGFYLSPGMEIKLYIKNNNTQAWEHLSHPTLLTGTSGITDNASDTWYFFSQTLVLPQGSQYWTAAPNGQRFVIAQIKSNAVGSNGSETSLTTFDVTADGCIDTYKPQGGAAIRQNCASSASPVATLNVACGASDKLCCLAAPACNYGKNCTSGACTVSCGGLNQACCAASPGCGANTICQSNTCIHCGSTNETCCAGNSCAAGNVCKNGSCSLCGATNQACCAGNSCNSGNVCTNGSCGLCGGVNQPCCTGSACSSGLACTSGTCQVPPCGGWLQGCCNATSCDVPNDPNLSNALVCVNPGSAFATCQACGGQGEKCCNGNYGCAGSLGCTSKYQSSNTCEVCGTYDNCPPPN